MLGTRKAVLRKNKFLALINVKLSWGRQTLITQSHKCKITTKTLCLKEMQLVGWEDKGEWGTPQEGLPEETMKGLKAE